MSFQEFFVILRARKRVILLVLLLVVGAMIGASALLPARWTAKAFVLVDAKGPDPVTGVVLPAQMLAGYMATQEDIIQSRAVALKVVDDLRLHESEAAKQQWREDTNGRGSLKAWLAERLLKKLDVKPSRDSSVVEIKYTNADPQFAARVANAFAQAYIATSLELKVEPARQQAKWFNERSQALRRDVEDSAAKLARYQQQKGIVSLDERLDTENARLEQYNAQLSQSTAQTADALARQRLARDAAARGIAPDSLPAVVENTLVQSLKTDLSRKEGRLRELSVQLGANHPQYIAAEADVESTRRQLRTEMRRVVASLDNNARIAQRREADIRSQVSDQKAKVLSLKKERDQLAALMRETVNAQNAYDATTKRYNQTALESQATQTNVAVLAPAVEPIAPSFPNWPLNIAISIFLGAMFGVGVALVLEMLDQRLRSAADVTRLLELPLLATLPRVRMPRAVRARLLTHRPTGTA
jgi:protein tyrosine kinase modulator